MFKACLFALVLFSTQPQAPLSTPAPPVQPAAPAAKRRCEPGFWVALVVASWMQFVEKRLYVPTAKPCPPAASPEMQDVQAKVPARTAEETNSEPSSRLAKLPAVEVMRQARLLFIRPRSAWFKCQKLERELLKRKEFGELGLEITRNAAQAELIVEITRKSFTTRFTGSFIEPASQRVVAAVTASSLGGEIEPHLAEAVLKQFKAVR